MKGILESKGKTEIEDISEIDNVLEYMDEHYSFVEYEKKENITFVDWCYEWIETSTLNIKTTTRSAYKSVIENHISRVFKKMLLDEVNANVIQQFIISLSKGIGIPKPLSAKTVKNIYGVVHKALSVAVKREYIHTNPADKVILPKWNRKEPNPMNTEQLIAFLIAIANHEKRDIYLLLLLTGLREGEVIGLTWDCYDEVNGTLKVYRQIIYNREKHVYEFGTLKNNKTRTLTLPKQARDLLNALKANDRSYGKYNFIFQNKDGEHYTEAAVYNAYKEIVTKIGYPEITVHDLRHTHAVLSLKAKVDPKTVQENLGHYSSTFTLDVYCKSLNEMKIQAAEQIEKYIDEITKESNKKNKKKEEKAK